MLYALSCCFVAATSVVMVTLFGAAATSFRSLNVPAVPSIHNVPHMCCLFLLPLSGAAADAIRPFILHAVGGVYLDLDSE
jgi:hypothetical protein